MPGVTVKRCPKRFVRGAIAAAARLPNRLRRAHGGAFCRKSEKTALPDEAAYSACKIRSPFSCNDVMSENTCGPSLKLTSDSVFDAKNFKELIHQVGAQ